MDTKKSYNERYIICETFTLEFTFLALTVQLSWVSFRSSLTGVCLKPSVSRSAQTTAVRPFVWHGPEKPVLTRNPVAPQLSTSRRQPIPTITTIPLFQHRIRRRNTRAYASRQFLLPN